MRVNTYLATRPLIVGAISSMVGLSFIGAGTALAQDFPGPLVTIDWDWSGGNPAHYVMHEDSDEFWYDPKSSAWSFIGSDGGQSWGMDWDVMATGNPANAASGTQFVTANLAVTNNTDQYQAFSALVTLALPNAFVGGTLMRGSVAVSVTDVFGGGAEVRSSGNAPIYQAFINNVPPGAPVETLMNPFYSLTAPPNGGNSDSETFGIPNAVPGPAALTTISVYLNFELSPFDTANVVGYFEISKVPAPGALPMLAAFVLGFGGRRRRA
jgi:uncharacterized protein (TIGR03382 family)